MTVKSLLSFLLSAVLIMSLGGCYYYDAGTENLLIPPKLTEGQNEIYQVLQAQVGAGITLKYPRSGDYRSAFVIEDIDGEPGDEALVFYQNSMSMTGTSALTVSILDQKDGRWVPAYDIAVSVSDVDRLSFSAFGTEGEKYIIIGYMLTGDKDKVMHIYRYRDGVIEDLFEHPYTLFEVIDITDDDLPEILSVSSAVADKDGNSAGSRADLIRCQDGDFQVEQTVALDRDVMSYVNLQVGQIDNEQTAVYLDGVKGQEQISTQILFYEESELKNTFLASPALSTEVLRQAGNLSADIDSDGVIEIPLPERMAGYQDDEDAICFTRWMTYANAAFTEKYYSYLNLGLNYSLHIPEDLRGGLMTAKRERNEDKNSNEIVFYLFDSSLEESTQELFRICVIHRNNVDHSLADYQQIATGGQLSYFVQVSDYAEMNHGLTNEVLKQHFRLID